MVIPLLLLLTRARVVFYCHFPDQLLAAPRSPLHKLYRYPLDWLEEVTTGMAHHVLVNSNFTQGVFARTFSSLAARGLQPAVLHPAVSVPAEKDLQEARSCDPAELGQGWDNFLAAGPVFLSINRCSPLPLSLPRPLLL